MSTKLIFVYNAGSSIFNQVGDLIHKTISPTTYPCNLCGLTYSGIGMKNEWKDFIKSLPLKSEFLHKDEFQKIYSGKSHEKFPAVFVKKDNDVELLIGATEINKLKNLEKLEVLVRKKISHLTTPNS